MEIEFYRKRKSTGEENYWKKSLQKKRVHFIDRHPLFLYGLRSPLSAITTADTFHIAPVHPSGNQAF
jgi:hypothetical protein